MPPPRATWSRHRETLISALVLGGVAAHIGAALRFVFVTCHFLDDTGSAGPTTASSQGRLCGQPAFEGSPASLGWGSAARAPALTRLLHSSSRPLGGANFEVNGPRNSDSDHDASLCGDSSIEHA